MHIISIEPTPSPHSMKINVNEALPEGESRNYKPESDLSLAPAYIQNLFQIEGVKGLYQVTDFIALERHPKVAWEDILPEVRKTFGTEDGASGQAGNKSDAPADSFGEVKAFVQMYRGIPIQVKLDDGTEEQRAGLPEAYMEAVMEASAGSPAFVMERKWVEQGPRYGSMEEVSREIVDELTASYDRERLRQLVEAAKNEEKTPVPAARPHQEVTPEMLDNPDWKARYAALDRLDPGYENLPLLGKALDDEKASIRRLAVAYLGMIEEPEVLPYLYKALKDKAVTVRRTAGDCLSDLGFREAMPEMAASLSDPNRLVRWRAAMFLYEVGDESALPSLKAVAEDPEFEVRMQVMMAIERIEGGKEAKGSVWHQMTQAVNKNK